MSDESFTILTTDENLYTIYGIDAITGEQTGNLIIGSTEFIFLEINYTALHNRYKGIIDNENARLYFSFSTRPRRQYGSYGLYDFGGEKIGQYYFDGQGMLKFEIKPIFELYGRVKLVLKYAIDETGQSVGVSLLPASGSFEAHSALNGEKPAIYFDCRLAKDTYTEFEEFDNALATSYAYHYDGTINSSIQSYTCSLSGPVLSTDKYVEIYYGGCTCKLPITVNGRIKNNNGLKLTTKQFRENIGNIDICANLFSGDYNMHLLLPLFETFGYSKIELGLIFNTQQKSMLSEFGYGFKLKQYKKISIQENQIYISNSDGSVSEFVSNDSIKYENYETNQYIEKATENDGIVYKLFDQQGNHLIFVEGESCYPQSIVYKSGEVYNLIYDENNHIVSISNSNGDEISFIKGDKNLIEIITWKHCGVIVTNVSLSYNNAYQLNCIIVTNDKSKISTSYSITYSNNSIILSDNITGDYAELILLGNLLYSIKKGFNGQLNNNLITNFKYTQTRTTVLDSLGNVKYYIFDYDGILKFEIDEKNNYIAYQYNKELKKYIQIKKSHINNNVDTLNLLGDAQISSFINYSLSSETLNETDELYINMFGAQVQKYNGTGSLKFSKTESFNSTDVFTLYLWVKQLKSKTDNCYANIKLSLAETSANVVLDKVRLDNEYYPVVLGLVAEKSGKEIIIDIDLIDSSVIIGDVCLSKTSFGLFYQYDDYGNVISVGNANNNAKYEYNDNNLPITSLTTSSKRTIYQYDDKNNITESLGAYQIKNTKTYDNKNRITKSLTTNYDNTKVYEKTNTYVSDSNVILKDELENETIVINDNFGNILSVTNALNEVLTNEYYENNLLKKILLTKDEKSKYIEYVYDEEHHDMLKTVTLSNGSVYEYMYDDLDRLISILCNGIVLTVYSYDDYNRVITIQYGSDGDKYEFTYNSDSSILTFKVGNELYNYVYDDCRRLIRIACNDETYKEFEYDLEGKLNKINIGNNTIKYRYDNLNNIIGDEININDKIIITEYSHLLRSNGCNPEALYGAFDSNFMNCMFINNETNLMGPYNDIEMNVTSGNISVIRDGIIPCIKVENAKFEYMMNEGLKTGGTIGFWVKPLHITNGEQTLLKLCSSDSTNNMRIVKKVDGKIYVTFYNGNQSYSGCSNVELTTNWTFIGLNWIYSGEKTIINLMIDGIVKLFNTNIGFNTGDNPKYVFGDTLDSYISCIMCGYKDIISTEGLLLYYRTSNDYIFTKELNNYGVDFSNVISYNEINDTEVIPLHNSVKSLNGLEPTVFEQRKVASYDKDRTFNYNNAINNYCYVADGHHLTYKLIDSYNNTIGMNVYMDTVCGTRTIFEHKTLVDRYRLGLIIVDGMIKIDSNGRYYDTGLTLEPRKWTFVGLAINKTDTIESDQSSFDTNNFNVFTYRVFKDDDIYEVNGVDTLFEPTTCETSIGRMNSNITIETDLGSYESNCPLLGQIEMIFSKNDFCSLTDIMMIKNKLKYVTVSTGYDEFGLEKSKTISVGNKILYSKTNSYKNGTNNINNSIYIKSEYYKFNNLSVLREYEVDETGKITSINNDSEKFEDHVFEYDFRGYLIKENNTMYDYDDNGNIIKCGDDTFEYSSVYKDKLVKALGYEIIYSDKYSYNPVSWNSINYSWLGRRLSNVNYEGKLISFKYDDNGLIINKTVNNLVTKYYYDDDLLITQINDNYRLDFIYDENELLCGFIYNDIKYFYVRDLLYNIIGIIDIDGNLLVSYNYDIYGNNTIITGDTTLGNINPFRYKEYYYDDDIKLYIVGDKLYNPLWKRWLNSKEIFEVDHYNIDSVNLYSNSNNSPINEEEFRNRKLMAKGGIQNHKHTYLNGVSPDDIANELKKYKGKLDGKQKKKKKKLVEQQKALKERNKKKRKNLNKSQITLDNFGSEFVIYNDYSNDNIKIPDFSIDDKLLKNLSRSTVLGLIGYVVINNFSGIGVFDDLSLIFLIPLIFLVENDY